jgi:ribosome-binding protein aMBF1 (putative translation factor)
MSRTPRSTRRRSTSDAVEILDRTLVGKSRARREAADRAFEDALVGQIIYEARNRAKLTQKQLAHLVGTDQAVISRLEDANYEGHSLTMLRRIASALGKRLEIRFVDAA